MENNEDFTAKLQKAIDEKVAFFNSTELPKVLENYRLIHTCVKNISDSLINNRLINPDPYKTEENNDKKSLPPEEAVSDHEIPNQMGIRLSEYESKLNFICNYYTFTESFLTFSKIEKLNILNSYINWSSCTSSNTRPNTKMLGTLLTELRKKNVGISSLNNMVKKTAESFSENSKILEEYLELKKEIYKMQVRNSVIKSPNFNKEHKNLSVDEEIKEIKNNFLKELPKTKIYSNLIQQIAEEDSAPNKIELQNNILQKLKINNLEIENKDSKLKINTKEILMDSIKTLSSMNEEFSIITEIVVNNYEVLESEHNTFFDRLRKFFQQIFSKKPKEVIYEITIEDFQKKTKYQQHLDIIFFIKKLQSKTNLFYTLEDKDNQGFQKLFLAEEDSVFQFLNKNLAEIREIFLILNGLDSYFKSTVSLKNKTKIKGLKIELMTLQNALIKANQKRSEYIGIIEQQIYNQNSGTK